MIRGLDGKFPVLHKHCFIAETADIIGDVHVEEDASIWYNSVIRGDEGPLYIGARTNIQDMVAIHCNHHERCTIGEDVTIGHRAIIHGCTIHDRVLVGMGAIILDGAVIEEDVIIGAGTLIASNKRIPSKSLVVGIPGKIIRTLTESEIADIKASADAYVDVSKKY